MNLLGYIKNNPQARERKNKNKVVSILIWNTYARVYENETEGFEYIPKNVMSDMVGEILSLDRKWRKILEENPELRGKDYNDKKRLEEEKLISFGYEPTP